MTQKGTYNDITGEVFGDLKVEEFIRIIPKKGSVWLCRCKCGKTRAVTVVQLRSSTHPVTQCRDCAQQTQRRVARTRWCRPFGKNS